MKMNLKNQKGLTRGGLIILLFIVVIAIIIIVKSFSTEPKTEKVENKVAGYSNIEYKEINHDSTQQVVLEEEETGYKVNNKEVQEVTIDVNK